jgi:hypothetical protein
MVKKLVSFGIHPLFITYKQSLSIPNLLVFFNWAYEIPIVKIGWTLTIITIVEDLMNNI